MTARPTLLLLHGWGFDASLWDRLVVSLTDFPIARWDRGYFGSASQAEVDSPVIGVGHSLGAMLLASLLPPHVPLVAINGFDRFAGEARVPARVIERMRSKFPAAPAGVLENFRDRLGAPAPPPNFDAARLEADLDLLATASAPPVVRRILLLQGALDPLLPPAMQDAVFPDGERRVHEEAGHLLPITHPLWCAEAIRAFACA